MNKTHLHTLAEDGKVFVPTENYDTFTQSLEESGLHLYTLMLKMTDDFIHYEIDPDLIPDPQDLVDLMKRVIEEEENKI